MKKKSVIEMITNCVILNQVSIARTQINQLHWV